LHKEGEEKEILSVKFENGAQNEELKEINWVKGRKCV